jgi:ABC-type Na+ efflux pump permease subunit
VAWTQAAWFIARKDVKYMLRQRETLLWVFLMPPLFFFFIGSITGGFAGDANRRDGLTVVAPTDAGFLVEHVARRLEDQDFAVERATVLADSAAGDHPPNRLLTFPPAFTDSILAGIRTPIELTLAGNELGLEYDRARVQRAIYSVVADLVVTRVKYGREPDPRTLVELYETPRSITLNVTAAGERRRIPSGFEQAVPGTLTMFTLLVLFTTGAVLLVIERREGLLRRLASAPLSRGAIVLGKWSGRMGLGIVQISFAMVTGSLLFGMQWGSQLPALCVVLVAYSGLAAALGMLLGNLARSEGQAIGIGVLATNILAPLGGCWWPIEVTPVWMQKLALFLPTGWAMNALHKLVSFGLGPSAVVPHVAVLAVAALVCGWLAARTFRFQ